MSVEEKSKDPSVNDEKGLSSANPNEISEEVSQSLKMLKSFLDSSINKIDLPQSIDPASLKKILEFIDQLIERSKNGEIVLPSSKLSENRSLDVLTRRERQILDLISQGLANKHIAHQLKISIRTVEVHRSNLTKKLGIKSTAGLVRLALSRGLV